MRKLSISSVFGNKMFCEACQFGKMKQAYFPLSDFKSKGPLELVYFDLWGPTPMCSSEGFRHYMLFVDDFN